MLSEQFIIEAKLKRDKVADFSVFPFNLSAVANLDNVRFDPSITFFVGENGSGKSTLLEAIAVAAGFNPEGGTKNFSFSTHASHSDLDQYLRLSRGIKKPRDGFFLRAESFYNVASEIESLDSEPAFAPKIIESYGGKSLHEQSHGESFMALMLNRFSGNSLYILDEPEAALSPARQLTMLVRIKELIEQGCQFIVATHSPIIMAYPNALIYALSETGLQATQYEDTEHFQITKRFMNNYAGMLHNLLAD